MSDHQLIQKMGAAILLPKVGEVAYFTDSSGNLKQVDSAGNVTTGGVPVATPSASGLMSAAQAASLAPMSAGAYPAICFTSAPVDFTTAGVYAIGAPVAARMIAVVSPTIEAKTVGGTRSTAPTFSIGTNSPNFDNIFSSQTQPAGLLTAAAETSTSFFTGLSANCPDMTTSGIKINITSGLAGSAPVFTGVVSLLVKTAPV